MDQVERGIERPGPVRIGRQPEEGKIFLQLAGPAPQFDRIPVAEGGFHDGHEMAHAHECEAFHAICPVLTAFEALGEPIGRGRGCKRRTTGGRAGARLAPLANTPFVEGTATGTVLTVRPDSTKQTIDGIGTSFTGSSAFVPAHLAPARRREVMRRIYGKEGADFTLARTPIGSCDFSVEGKSSYDARPDDMKLDAFTIAPDTEGFDPARYPGVGDPGYDLLPMIREALAIKKAAGTGGLRIIASAWTAAAAPTTPATSAARPS